MKLILFFIGSKKKNNACANKAPFMTEELHKAIMKSSRLANKFLKHRTDRNQINFKLQRNFCKTLSRSVKEKSPITVTFER